MKTFLFFVNSRSGFVRSRESLKVGWFAVVLMAFSLVILDDQVFSA